MFLSFKILILNFFIIFCDGAISNFHVAISNLAVTRIHAEVFLFLIYLFLFLMQTVAISDDPLSILGCFLLVWLSGATAICEHVQ